MLMLVPGIAHSANPVRLDTIKTRLVIPRPALEPLKSLVTSPNDPIDTRDTVNEHVKVILYGDNTWQYYKTPDFKKLAEAHGARAVRVIDPAKLDAAVKKAVSSNETTLVEVIVEPRANVYPMIPAGKHVSEMYFK